MLSVDELVDHIRHLSNDERQTLLNAIITMLPPHSLPDTDVEPTMSAEEAAAYLAVEPLPPAEVAAKGVLGTWADMGIEDGAAWVNEQKAKRKARLQW